MTSNSYVTLSDGTGIVHIAPAFGEDDARVGRKYNLPFVQLVDAQGCLTEEPSGRACSSRMRTSSCWRTLECGLLFARRSSSTDSVLLALRYAAHLLRPRKLVHQDDRRARCADAQQQQKVNWMPDNIKEGRMGNFLDNVIDWGLREPRYWGTPLPVWECKCGHVHAVGSIAEAEGMLRQRPDGYRAAPPYVDPVTIRCPQMRRRHAPRERGHRLLV